MTPDPELLAAERAIDEVRCGRPVVVRSAALPVVYGAVETIDADRFRSLRDFDRTGLSLVVSAHRARALGRPDDDPAPARLLLPPHASLADATALACVPPDGERRPPPMRDADVCDRAVVDLLRTAWLLPAALRASVSPETVAYVRRQVERGILHQVTAAALASLSAGLDERVSRVSDARIPLADASDARFVCFRSALGNREHLAIVIGDPDPGYGVPVRLHSACLTGDVFGSLRCDCGDQLRQSLGCLRDLGGGVLLYLAQEGRGIGLANKLRAYALQDGGRDTIDADQQLGFGPDERTFGVAAAMLRELGYVRIRLMTNNPDKIEALAAAGIEIVGRLPLVACITPENRRYMDAKRIRARHLLDEGDCTAPYHARS